jgi:GT2 family glycosyltransferase
MESAGGGLGDRPSFSVVIASRRPPASVRACLGALEVQDYPDGLFEVVVVDDGSPVSLAPVAEELGGRLRVRVHTQANTGPAAARNAGARHASGRFLAFTDDDCMPAPDWLSRLADALRDDPGALVGGAVANALPDDRFAEATQGLMSFLERSFADDSRRRFFTSNNMALSRDAFLEAGGFDATFPVPGGEDRELCERWQFQGRTLVAAPRAVVWHSHAMTLRSFVRQHRNYGRGAYQLRQSRLEDDARFSPEPVGFYLRLVADPFRRLPLGAALAQSALLVVSQLATAVGYLIESRRSRGS